MKLFNNTSQDVGYYVNYEGGGDCGTISSGETVENGNWSNQQYDVQFYTMPYDPNTTPTAVEIDSTGTGTTVTIGVYYE